MSPVRLLLLAYFVLIERKTFVCDHSWWDLWSVESQVMRNPLSRDLLDEGTECSLSELLALL